MAESIQPARDLTAVAVEPQPVAAAASSLAVVSRAAELPVGTVTFLFSDVVGSSPVTERRGDREAREFYRRHDEVIRGLAAAFEGHIVRQDGDGFFISFRSTRQALRCAMAIQRGLRDAYAGLDERAHVRIGMHVGETIEEDGDYYGTAVNMAARVRAEAAADQIIVTGLVRALASGEPEFHYRFIEETTLRGFQGRIRLYELTWRDEDREPLQSATRAVAASSAAIDEADLRAYAAALTAWCSAGDLSEWAGRYVPLAARLLTPQGVLSTQDSRLSVDLQYCFARYARLVVAGDGGSGKTTALLEATRRAAHALDEDPAGVIPIFVQLRAWRPGQDFLDLALESLAARGLVRSRETLLAWLQAGRCLLILDGFNELPATVVESEAQAELEALPHRFPQSRLIVSTRQRHMEQQFPNLSAVVVQPLRPHDVLQYIQQYVGDPERAEAIFVSLGGRDRAAWLQRDSLISLARNPLLLNVIISQELTAGGAFRPSRGAVLWAYNRHVLRADLLRGSRLIPEVKEALLGYIAYAWRSTRRSQAMERSDLAQLIRAALLELREEGLIPSGLDPTTVLAEIDRRFLSPLLPEAGLARYDWSHTLFLDYFVAFDLRRRHFPAGRLRDRRGLEELFADESWYRWSPAALFLSELLEDAGCIALWDVCLHADNLVLTCRCVSHSISGAVESWRLTASVQAQLIADLLRRRSADAEREATGLQDPFVVVCEALLEREPGAESDTETLEACLGTAILATVFEVDVPGVLAALSLGLGEPELRAIAWAFGRDAREVALLRGRLLRLHDLPATPGSPEQQHLRQGLLLALAGSPAVVLLELCRRAQVLINADRASTPSARALARDTAGVHAPLARRLGLWRLAGLLEDLCLQVLDHEEFARVAALAEDLRLLRRERRLDWFSDVLSEHLQGRDVAADIQSAMPGLSGIATELRRLGELRLPRATLHGLGRIVVNVAGEEDCAAVMAALEELWPGTAPAEPEAVPLIPAVARPGRHELVAYPPEGGFVRVLVQTIPSEEAALERRWSGEPGGQGPLRVRMQRLLDELEQAGGERRVFVLTASGEVVALPEGSTPIDFAYHIHTRLGHRCAAALVNGGPELLTYMLRHGDRVQIMVDPQRELPPAEWLERSAYLHTARARKAVQQALEAARRADAIAFGRAIVEEELARANGDGLLSRLLKALGFQREERLYETVGRGEVARREVAYTLAALREGDAGGASARHRAMELDVAAGWPLVIAGGEGDLRPRYARCCRPQPGDPIQGYQSGQTVVVHHAACPVGAATAKSRPAVEVRWPAPDLGGTVLIRIRARKTRTIAPAVRRVAEMAGVQLVDLVSSRAVEGDITLSLECRGSKQEVAALLDQLRQLPEVSMATALDPSAA